MIVISKRLVGFIAIHLRVDTFVMISKGKGRRQLTRAK